jgi:uridylate kinase
VDGVYDSDPNIFPDAKKFEMITYNDVLTKRLGVMDSTATSLSMDNQIPLILFGLDDPENIIKVIMGDKVGTTVF